MEIIGLAGFARSGKSEVAKILVEEFGFTQVAYADRLRDMAYILNPVVVANNKYHGMISQPDYGGPVYMRLRWVIDNYGWENYKRSPFSDDIRGFIQRLGTEGGRQTMGEDVWVDALFDGLNADKVVITDCRFTNELDAVRSRGGYLWRIRNPEIGPLNGHASETEAVDYPYYSLFIENNGTLDDLRHIVVNEYALGRYKEWNY